MFAKRRFLIHSLPCLLLLMLLGTLSVPSVQAQSTLAVVDNEPVDIAPGEPGPGDNMVFSVRRNATYVVSLAFTTGQPGEIVSHRLTDDGQLELVGRTPAGREPRAIAMARNGEYAVLVNSIDNQLAVMAIGDDGLLREVSRTGSGGNNPYDVAVGFNDVVVVANRDSGTINTFDIDRRGHLTPLSQAAAGIDPHVVSVSSRGFVGVANQTSRSVSLYELDKRGGLTRIGQDVPAAGVPRTLTWSGNKLFVAVDVLPTPAMPLVDDVISLFEVNRNRDRRGLLVDTAGDTSWQPSVAKKADESDWQVNHLGDTPAGSFLTDIDVSRNRLFAVTVNRNVISNSTDDRDEVRVYRIEGTQLVPDAAAQTDVFPPSFKQVSTFRGKKPGVRHVIVSEFQSGWLRSLLYAREQNR